MCPGGNSNILTIRTQPNLSAHKMSWPSTTRSSSRVSSSLLAIRLLQARATADSVVTKLNAIREDQSSMQAGPSSNAPTPNDERASSAEPNRVDTVLADVFALLSLFFLTIGKSRETPAIYCQIASMRVSQLLIPRQPPLSQRSRRRADD